MEEEEEKINKALLMPVKSLLEVATDETWPAIRQLLQLERMTTLVGFTSSLSSFNIDQKTIKTFVTKLENYAISIVESKATEEAGRVLMNMEDRFEKVFSCDSDSMPRLWTEKEDIKAITKMARLASLKLLSVLAVIRLDEKTDSVEQILQLVLENILSYSPSNRNCSLNTLTKLTSNTWGEVPSTRTLISPVQCMSLWRQFNKNTNHIVKRAMVVQENSKRKNMWLPPPWAITAILLLGFNYLTTILRNPSYILVICVVFFLSKMLWVLLDISGEFKNGTLLGILSICAKFISILMGFLKRRAEMPAAPDTGRNLT